MHPLARTGRRVPARARSLFSGNPLMPRRCILLVLLASAPVAPLSSQNRSRAPAVGPIQREYQAVAGRIIAAATEDSAAWQKLAELTDRFGNRLSGSDALER